MTGNPGDKGWGPHNKRGWKSMGKGWWGPRKIRTENPGEKGQGPHKKGGGNPGGKGVGTQENKER